MASSLTFFSKNTTILVCNDKGAKHVIGRDVLQEERDVAHPKTFSQLNLEGEMVTYEVVLCKPGGPIYAMIAAKKED